MARTESLGVKWNDLNSGYSYEKGSSAPTLTTLVGNLKADAFSGSGPTDLIHGSFEILHDYKEGTDLYPHVHWMPTTNGAGTVKWVLDYGVAKTGSVLSVDGTIPVTQAASGVAYQEQVIEFGTAITGTNLKVGDQIVWTLSRPSSAPEDDYAGSAALISFGVHYQTDDIGSINRFSN